MANAFSFACASGFNLTLCFAVAGMRAQFGLGIANGDKHGAGLRHIGEHDRLAFHALGEVVRHDRAAIRQSDGGDLQVIRSNRSPLRFQMMAKTGTHIGAAWSNGRQT